MFFTSLSLLLWTAVTGPQPLPEALGLGHAAPQLARMEFLRGEPVTEFRPGTIYAIEFSGTTCVPCLECIPKLNELQRIHPGVVILSVYCEEADAVRAFLSDRGAAIEIRVAADPQSEMWTSWSQPACREGIPHAFIVGKDGKLAWIGHPGEMAEPLANIVAGTFDPRADLIRLQVEQQVVLRQRRLDEREEQGHREYQRINDQIIAGRLADALTATEHALHDYADCPRTIQLLRSARVYELALLPERRDKAAAAAVELAIDTRWRGGPMDAVNLASTLLNAAGQASPEARDPRLVDVALVLLPEAPPRGFEAFVAQLRGTAWHLRGNNARAAGFIREAIQIVRTRQAEQQIGPTSPSEATDPVLIELEALLQQYTALAGKEPD